MVLIDIESRLKDNNQDLTAFGLPVPEEGMRSTIVSRSSNQELANLPRIIQEELLYDRHHLQHLLNIRLDGSESLLPSQRAAFDLASNAVRDGRPLNAFIDARGGTGKTFTLNTMLASARSLRRDRCSVALDAASSGIAATVSEGGRTFHTRFKVPLNIIEIYTWSIAKQSALADLIRCANLIVWDEAPVAHRHILEAWDRTLRDITDCELPFGGKVLVLAGDF